MSCYPGFYPVCPVPSERGQVSVIDGHNNQNTSINILETLRLHQSWYCASLSSSDACSSISLNVDWGQKESRTLWWVTVTNLWFVQMCCGVAAAPQQWSFSKTAKDYGRNNALRRMAYILPLWVLVCCTVSFAHSTWFTPCTWNWDRGWVYHKCQWKLCCCVVKQQTT